jgi:acyl carrier protein
LAVRGGQVSNPRLTPVEVLEPAPASASDSESEADRRVFAPGGTVLITGGTGTLGGLVARHLVQTHAVRRLILASRQGPAAPGAGELAAELVAAGAYVDVVALDVSDRAAVFALVQGIGVAHPLTGVIHTAGVLEDATIGGLTAGHLDRVFGPKFDGAWFLHEATVGLDLGAFVVFSSLAGVTGNAGQGNYAAANTLLDGLAEFRRGLGLPGTSVAWGLWETLSGMTGAVSAAELSRGKHAGVHALDSERGLALLDGAMASSAAVLVAADIDGHALGGGAVPVPAPLRSLVPAARRTAAQGPAAGADGVSLSERLVRLPVAERRGLLIEMVAGHVAATVGHAGASAINPGHAFKDLGFDSLAALELRNRLTAATGARLPATLIFDYPTPDTVTDFLLTLLVPDDGSGGARDEEGRVRQLLATVPLKRLKDAGVLERLLQLAEQDDDAAEGPTDAGLELIAAMDVDSLVARALGTV